MTQKNVRIAQVAANKPAVALTDEQVRAFFAANPEKAKAMLPSVRSIAGEVQSPLFEIREFVPKAEKNNPNFKPIKMLQINPDGARPKMLSLAVAQAIGDEIEAFTDLLASDDFTEAWDYNEARGGNKD